MSMKLSEVKAKVKDAKVEWEGEVVDFGYHPAATTPELLESVQGAATSEDVTVLGRMLDPMLDWWDVLDDEGHRLPTDQATINQMPVSFLVKITEAVQADFRPPESRG